MAGEKTEKATERRKRKAREEGQVAVSRDLTAAIVLVGTFFAADALMGFWSADLSEVIAEVGGWIRDGATSEQLTGLAHRACWQVLQLSAPVLATALALALIVPYVQARPQPTSKPMVPSLEKLNPAKRLKQMFASVSGWMEFLKACAKVATISTVTYLVIVSQLNEGGELTARSVGALAEDGRSRTRELFGAILGVFLVLAILDLLYQRWNHERQLRMSKDDVRDEMRDDEGTPEMRAARSRFRQEMDECGTLEDISGCQVVITNPTHIACALRYDPDREAAPRVMAKGRDAFAQQIKGLARSASVPVREDRPLARALINVELRQQVPAELYEAVAEILRWAKRIDAGRNSK